MAWHSGEGRLAHHWRIERGAAGSYGQKFEKGPLEMRVVECIEKDEAMTDNFAVRG